VPITTIKGCVGVGVAVLLLLGGGLALLPYGAWQVQAGGEAGAAALEAPQGAQAPQPKFDLPVSGKAGPGLGPIDKAMKSILQRHGIPGGALAIAKDGRLVLAKGYGWANLETGETVTPLTLFGLASLSKPITALAILLLMEQGKLGLDEPAFAYIKHIQPRQGARVDPRLSKITVRQLLNHSGGWNRAVSGDPIGWTPQMSKALGAAPPLAPEHFISFMMGEPLDFEPGAQSHYSNVGYIILGQIVEKLSGQSYEEYAKKHVLDAVGAKRAGMNYMTRYLEGESRRYHAAAAAAPHGPGRGRLERLARRHGPALDRAGRQPRQAAFAGEIPERTPGSTTTAAEGQQGRLASRPGV
jgi:CubicO group peptidase (beta-lactamase class C family)